MFVKVSGCGVSPVMKGDKSVSSGIEDDHLPFFKLGVRYNTYFSNLTKPENFRMVDIEINSLSPD